MPKKKELAPAKNRKQAKFTAKIAGPDRNGQTIVSRKDCIEMLEAAGPISGALSKKLKIPKSLHKKEGSSSFTSEPDESMAGLMDALLMGMPIPADLPNYGIELNSHGSTTYGVLVDKKRKIIVMGDVMNAYDDEGNWEFFSMGLREALNAAKSLEKEGKEFLFVVNKELSTSVLQ